MKWILLIQFFILVGCSSETSYEGEVRGSVTNMGAERTLNIYREAAKGGGGEDLFKLYWLLEIDGHLIPEYTYSTLQGSEAILNCAAQTDFEPALDRALFRIQAAHNPTADKAAQCVIDLRSSGASGSIWRQCGAQAALPNCPLEFRVNLKSGG